MNSIESLFKINDMSKSLLEQLKCLDLSGIDSSDESVGQTLRFLLNAVEELIAENQQLREENQKLKDEINRLKGEQACPTIGPQKKAGDISSEAERKTKKPKGKRPKRKPLKIDRTEHCKVDRATLPADAIKKGVETSIIQDLELKTQNIEFHREIYYSPSKRKRYVGELPPGYSGEFGPGVKSLICVLYHDANLSQPGIVRLLNSSGLDISAATVSRILRDKASVFHEEKRAIFEAGLQSSSDHHIDDTSARVNGKNHYVHVLCNRFYAAYFTRPQKDRLTLLELLSPGGLRFSCDRESIDLMKTFGLPEKQCSRLIAHISDQLLRQEEMDSILADLFPDPGKQTTNRKTILEACAVTAYRRRTDAINILVCDDAPQFKNITELLSLCWVHEGRHYKKLCPFLALHQQLLEQFLSEFWDYYRELLAYKATPNTAQAKGLSEAFDHLFSQKTGYDVLDDRIEKTQQKKSQLLLVLDYPHIELHNNPAELSARAQARKRDVSLQTKNQAGTQAKDTFMTIVQTAKKLSVNILDYMKDRFSQAYAMPSLADLIRQRTQTTSDTS